MEFQIPFSGQEIDTSDDATDNASAGAAAVLSFLALFASVGIARSLYKRARNTIGEDRLSEVPLA